MPRPHIVIRALSAAALALLAGPLSAQQSGGCDEPIHAAFDFWVGEWEVHGVDGRFAGHNTIRKIAGGCGLTEDWRGVGGSVGESLNLYDPVTGMWHQRWVDASGLVLNLAGGPTNDGAMRMEGRGPDTTRLHRVTWTPRDDGSVRQLWQRSEDEGGSWSVIFDGIYTRIPTPETLDVGADRCDSEQGRRFAFWPGEWRVRSRMRGPDGGWRETTGVWRAEEAMGGCGYVDHTTGDYGSGPMSGVGTRFYDPVRDVWTITWVSTRAPGRMGVWEGRFDDAGVGEFLQDVEGPDGPVRTRIRWWNITGDSLDWHYAVSSDGGRTWQVQWEMELTKLAPGR